MSSPIDWTKIKALSFDIYGTLIDWENGIAASARATSLGPYLPNDHKDLMLAIERHDTTVQRENPTMRQSDVIAEGLRRYAAELKIVESNHLSPSQVDAAATQYASQIGAYPAFSDSVAAMRTLGARFLLLALSNVDNDSLRATRAGPLRACPFDAVYTAQDVGSYKPDLRTFEYLLERVERDFGVRREEVVHVAQSLFHDHGPAKEVGVQGVWVDRKGFMGGERENAQERFGFKLRVETLGELAAIVEEAFRGREGE